MILVYKVTLHQKRNSLTTVIACVILAFFLVISAFSLYSLITRNEQQIIDHMESISKGRRVAALQLIEGNFQFMRGLTAAVPFPSMTSGEQMAKLLDEVAVSNHYLRMGLADSGGLVDFVNLDGTVLAQVDMSGYSFFQEALEGNAAVSDTFYDEETGQDINYYAMPVLSSDGGEIHSVLCAAASGKALQDILVEPIGEASGYFVLVNAEGTIVSSVPDTIDIVKTGGNIFDMAAFTQADQLLDALQTGTGGCFEMKAIKLHRRIVVVPLGLNDWSIMCVIPQKTVDIYYNITALMVAVIALTAFVLFVMIWQIRLFSRSNRELGQLAYADPLTGALNYPKFLLDAPTLLQAPSKKKFAVWSADIKRFRLINSIYGNAVGDRALIRVASVLKDAEEDDCLFCRISADRFVGIRAYREKQELETWFEGITTRLAERKVISTNKITNGASMGFYCLEDFKAHPPIQEMVNNATMAKNMVKAQPGNQTCYYTNELGKQARRESALEASGRTALQNGEITFFVQPKVRISNGFLIVGGEVLMRWQHPSMGWVSPGEFLPLFENSGFIVEADRYIFDRACAWYAETQKQGVPVFQLSINVSRQGLLYDDFVDHYSAVKEKYGIADGVLELEFTESTPMDDYELFQSLATEVQHRGFICSIDDFGSGYSSLKVLKDLPINVLKLDTDFFYKDTSTAKEQIVVSDFIGMAQKLRIKVVAEGIETPAQVSFLQNVGCDMIQGYIFSSPVPQENFINMFTKNGGHIQIKPLAG